MESALTLLCGLIGLPETATETEIIDRAKEYRADVERLKSSAEHIDQATSGLDAAVGRLEQALADREGEIAAIREEIMISDLECFSDVIGDIDSAKELLRDNRRATVKLFIASLVKHGSKKTRLPGPAHIQESIDAPLS